VLLIKLFELGARREGGHYLSDVQLRTLPFFLLIPVKENQQDVVFISVWGRDFQSQVKQCRYAALVLPVGMRGQRSE
jgi:hypothetical protein